MRGKGKPNGTPLGWDKNRGAQLRPDLDAFYASAYSPTDGELRYILELADVTGSYHPSETIRSLREKEVRQFGEYRTRRLALAAWDRMEVNGEFTAMEM